MDNLELLKQKLDPRFLKENEPLSKHTTVRIGGPADLFYEPNTNDLLIKSVEDARELEIPVTMIGRGSNTLISDKGIRGLVIKSNAKEIKIGDEIPVTETDDLEKEVEARLDFVSTEEGGRTMYKFEDLDYDESDKPRVEVKIDSGIDMSFAINYLIGQGVTGLQWYARIPGTLGGWVHNNVHGGSHFIQELIKDVTVLTPEGKVETIGKDELDLGYDQSRFHDSGEIILSATFELYKGDKDRARAAAIEWAKRKSVQPPISVGCIFKNISRDEKELLGYPSTSVGYIVEHVLKMKGFRIGDAAISPEHHNFIQNLGNATASDYLAVIKEIKHRAKKETGIDIYPEIFFLGFEPSEISDVVGNNN